MITAGYRDPALNNAERGSPGSQHLVGFAIDVNTGDPKTFAEIKRVMLLAGLTWGGDPRNGGDPEAHHFQLPIWRTSPNPVQVQNCARENSNAADDRGKRF